MADNDAEKRVEPEPGTGTIADQPETPPEAAEGTVTPASESAPAAALNADTVEFGLTRATHPSPEHPHLPELYIGTMKWPLFAKNLGEDAHEKFLIALNNQPEVRLAAPGNDNAGFLYVSLKPIGQDDPEFNRWKPFTQENVATEQVERNEQDKKGKEVPKFGGVYRFQREAKELNRELYAERYKDVILRACEEAGINPEDAGLSKPNMVIKGGQDAIDPSSRAFGSHTSWLGRQFDKLLRWGNRKTQGGLNLWRDTQAPAFCGKTYQLGTLTNLTQSLLELYRDRDKIKTSRDHVSDALKLSTPLFYILGNLCFIIGDRMDYSNASSPIDELLNEVDKKLVAEGGQGVSPLEREGINKLYENFRTELAKNPKMKEFRHFIGQNMMELNGAFIGASTITMMARAAIDPNESMAFGLSGASGLVSIIIQSLVPQPNGYNPIYEKFPRVAKFFEKANSLLPGPMQRFNEKLVDKLSQNRPFWTGVSGLISTVSLFADAVRKKRWFQAFTAVGYLGGDLTQMLMREAPNDDLNLFSAAAYMSEVRPTIEKQLEEHLKRQPTAKEVAEAVDAAYDTISMHFDKLHLNYRTFNAGDNQLTPDVPADKANNPATQLLQKRTHRFTAFMDEMKLIKAMPKGQERTDQLRRFVEHALVANTPLASDETWHTGVADKRLVNEARGVQKEILDRNMKSVAAEGEARKPRSIFRDLMAEHRAQTADQQEQDTTVLQPVPTGSLIFPMHQEAEAAKQQKAAVLNPLPSAV